MPDEAALRRFVGREATHRAMGYQHQKRRSYQKAQTRDDYLGGNRVARDALVRMSYGCSS